MKYYRNFSQSWNFDKSKTLYRSICDKNFSILHQGKVWKVSLICNILSNYWIDIDLNCFYSTCLSCCTSYFSCSHIRKPSKSGYMHAIANSKRCLRIYINMNCFEPTRFTYGTYYLIRFETTNPTFSFETCIDPNILLYTL